MNGPFYDSTMQPLDTAASRMQTCALGKSKGLWQTLTAGSCSEAFDGLGISLLLTSNPAIQVPNFPSEFVIINEIDLEPCDSSI